MSDAVISSIVVGLPPFLVALGTFWNVARVHKAVNSTATALATIAKEKEQQILRLESENATLKESLKGKDTVAAVIAAKSSAPS